VIVLGVCHKKIYLKCIKNKDKFIIEGYKDVEELEILYINAHLFLYPTLNEGFGYPPLEAMKYGTYVAVSAITSTTEVYGDAVLYFNPYDINEICNRILQSFDQVIMIYLS
jgi:glycosyltransferase involved in cell wall biosynthesis